ncbi:MAG: hypothetical protein LKI25_07680 [Atopobiaceae bacterium]|nr:hypothetical protein [Atopobiaceae bacterium]MCI2174067.1 hypothetical protein [Atopobiaceae bacterium]MCI2207843.1 hypothetical protein [Atopobiaceae bacterium]
MSDQVASQVSLASTGHVALVICSILYLAWWWLFFRSDSPKLEGVAYIAGASLIVAAAIAGCIGAVMVGNATGSLAAEASSTPIPTWTVAVGGVVVYLVLLGLTANVFHRTPTTELLLIVGWAALELGLVNALVGTGVLSTTMSCMLLALVLVLFCGSMVCYMLYYRLDAWPAFVDGCVPLVSVGIVSMVIILVLRWA